MALRVTITNVFQIAGNAVMQNYSNTPINAREFLHPFNMGKDQEVRIKMAKRTVDCQLGVKPVNGLVNARILLNGNHWTFINIGNNTEVEVPVGPDMQ